MDEQTFCAVNFFLCTRACFAIPACLLHLSPDFLGGVTSHSLSLYGDIVLEYYSTTGQLHMGQISFGPLPTLISSVPVH